MTYDAVVVGGGLVGTACAYELAGRGTRTLLVDRHDVGRATDAGAGILSPETITVDDDAWYALAAAAGDHYRALVPALLAAGAPDPGYAACGALRFAFRPGDDRWYAAGSELALRRAGDVLREVSPDEARAMVPVLGEVRAAMHNPRAARVDGRDMTAALRHGAVARGVEELASSVAGVVVERGRATAVETDAGDRIETDAVVVAGGAWTPALAAALGVDLPVAPTRGQILHLRTDHLDPTDPSSDTGAWPILQPVLSYYVVPWPDGRVAVGGTMEPDAGFEVRTTADGIRGLLHEMVQLAPGLGGASFAEVRVGLRPVSVDDAPIVGPLPGVERAFACTGHGANGLLLGPISGALVADAVVGVEPTFDLTPFAPDRFLG